jgi:hypothetical protein
LTQMLKVCGDVRESIIRYSTPIKRIYLDKIKIYDVDWEVS